MMKNIYALILTIFATCCFAQAPVMNAINGPTAVCSDPSSPLSFSTSASNSPTSYSWTVVSSSSVTITNANSSVTSISFPFSTGTYTIYCYASNGSGSSPTESFVVTVFETPTITFSGANTFCQGSSTNLSASSTILAASPTIFYNWLPASSLNTSSGPNVIAFPTVPTVYTVTATKGICSNTGTISVTPLNSPTVTANVSYASICKGSQYTLFGMGALTYTWTNNVINNIPFTPTVTNGYIVTGTGPNGCTDTAFSQIVVNPLPTFVVSSNPSVLCVGSSASFSVNGTGFSYSVNSSQFFNPYFISPTVTTTYTITGITAAGCTDSYSYTQIVASCIGLKEQTEETHLLEAFPNPNTGSFTIRSPYSQTILIMNSLGQTVRALELSERGTQISGLPSGIYIITAGSGRLKIVVNN